MRSLAIQLLGVCTKHYKVCHNLQRYCCFKVYKAGFSGKSITTSPHRKSRQRRP